MTLLHIYGQCCIGKQEIADEMSNAQDILVEDRNEATADRQLEDIDEQIQAWKRYQITKNVNKRTGPMDERTGPMELILL